MSNEARSFQKMVTAYLQGFSPACNIESFDTNGCQRKVDCFISYGPCSHQDTKIEALGCLCHFCECHQIWRLTWPDWSSACRKSEEEGNEHFKEGKIFIFEIYGCKWKQFCENQLTRNFSWEMFCYFQGDTRVGDKLNGKFNTIPSKLKTR